MGDRHVNPNRAMPKLVRAINKRIDQCKAYTSHHHNTDWKNGIHAASTYILRLLESMQETRWNEKFQPQLEMGQLLVDDWKGLHDMYTNCED